MARHDGSPSPAPEPASNGSWEPSSYAFEALRQDGDLVLYRACRDGDPSSVLVVTPAREGVSATALARLEHEFSLRDQLPAEGVAQPLALVRHEGRRMLVLADPGGEPLERLCGAPWELGAFLRVAAGVAAAVGRLHGQGLIHKDLKPAHVLVDLSTGKVSLTGLGLASRLRRERAALGPSEYLAGTLAYMAPEQTGRMNRSIDSRADLYALGVTFYQLLTGTLPFEAADALGWVHCHLARPPVPPAERVPGIPEPVSAVVLKLLAKAAEERYQTAPGLEHDLRRCLVAWECHGRIDPFPLGERDAPNRLLIPEELYGREAERQALLAAFERVVATGRPELVLVSGYAGLGKSSVVAELHKALVPPRGLFASGKVDQSKRDIPYATLAQAFQGLIRSLLDQGEAQLGRWRDAMAKALGPNGRLMVDLVPDLKALLGEPPPVPALAPQDAQRRFQQVFRRFLAVFARSGRPLVLFLDDLQWLDAATRELLEELLSRPEELQNLLLIGAYRDNEVVATHPLRRTLQASRQAGVPVQELRLGPLAKEDLGRLVAGALRCEPERADPLTRLVHRKTGGNPFFAIQFISALADEGLLSFDYGAGRWGWDLERIHAQGYTENVVELMVEKLSRLPEETRRALQQLACLGNRAWIT
jgi:hypothetical protein